MQAEYLINTALKMVNIYGRNDPFYAAKQEGASVNFKDLGSLKGAYFGTMSTPAIVINENLDDTMKKVVCAHELGHHILHRKTTQSCDSTVFNGSNTGILEREANIFAAFYLIDKNTALELLSNGNTIYQTAAILETDINLLSTMLNALNIADAPNSNFLK